MSNLSVNSRLPYFVISFFDMLICPPIDLNSSCVSPIMLEEDTEKRRMQPCTGNIQHTSDKAT